METAYDDEYEEEQKNLATAAQHRNGETYVWNAQISLFASIHNNFRAGFACISFVLVVVAALF